MKKSKKSKIKFDSQQRAINNNHISCSFGYRIDENGRRGQLECVGVSFDGRNWHYANVEQ